MNNNVKKGILGTIGAGVLAVGGFIWDNAGKDVAKDLTKTAIQNAAPEIKALIPEPFQAALLSGNVKPEQSTAFQAAYEQCHEQTANNPKIDLNDVVAVYDADITCLIVHKNQGEVLDKMAETNAELKQTLAEIRQKITQTTSQ